MQKTNINPTILQDLFESATNAADKGQAQYHTPEAWARLLALPLSAHRPVIVDLTCGDGALLRAARNATTRYLLGSDIDPGRAPTSGRADATPANDGALGETRPTISKITGDLTKLYPFMIEVDWRADLFVLNPPWDLHWHTGNAECGSPRLSALAESDVPAVRDAFATVDPRLGGGRRIPHSALRTLHLIDSTIATLCIALDRCSRQGEGYLIANESTLQRLIFGPNAPHVALAEHIWAHLVVDGNICLEAVKKPSTLSTLDLPAQAGPRPFKTGIIYFASSHEAGCLQTTQLSTINDAEAACHQLADSRLQLRQGSEARDWNATGDTTKLWQAVKQEWRINHQQSTVKRPFNLWLDRDGSIITALSLFEQHSSKVDKQEAKALFDLNGKQPMQLVLQRQQRQQLEQAAFGGRWKVAPALQEAVRSAVAQYHAVRAPLYPLPKIQRLGYLDEQDAILCEKELAGEFSAGQSYAIRTTTVMVTRQGSKVNLTGGCDAVQFDGQELAIFITNEAGEEKCFMEERLRDRKVSVSLKSEVGDRRSDFRRPASGIRIDYTLHELVDHFTIPDVADVATLHPEQYAVNLKRLEEIERSGWQETAQGGSNLPKVGAS